MARPRDKWLTHRVSIAAGLLAHSWVLLPLPCHFCLHLFHIFCPVQVHIPGWKSLSLLLPSEVFGLGWWPSICKSKVGTFLWFSAARQSFLKRLAIWLMSFWFCTWQKPKYKWFRQKWRLIRSENSSKCWIAKPWEGQRRCSNTMKAHAFPPVPDSFCTLIPLSLVKKPVPPSTYQKHGTQFVLPTHLVWKRHSHLLSVLGVQKSQGKALIGTAWARCPAYTNRLWIWSVMQKYDL